MRNSQKNYQHSRAALIVLPKVLPSLISDPDTEKSGRVMEALLRMKKIDIDQLQQAYAGSQKQYATSR